MSKLGSRLLRSAEEALAYAGGETGGQFVVHTPIDVKAIRAKLHLAQPEFAARFGLSVGTVRDWEQGRAVPDRAAQVLLRVIAAEPDMVQRVVEGVRERAQQELQQELMPSEAGSTGSASERASPPGVDPHGPRRAP